MKSSILLGLSIFFLSACGSNNDTNSQGSNSGGAGSCTENCNLTYQIDETFNGVQCKVTSPVYTSGAEYCAALTNPEANKYKGAECGLAYRKGLFDQDCKGRTWTERDPNARTTETSTTGSDNPVPSNTVTPSPTPSIAPTATPVPTPVVFSAPVLDSQFKTECYFNYNLAALNSGQFTSKTIDATQFQIQSLGGPNLSAFDSVALSGSTIVSSTPGTWNSPMTTITSLLMEGPSYREVGQIDTLRFSDNIGRVNFDVYDKASNSITLNNTQKLETTCNSNNFRIKNDNPRLKYVRKVDTECTVNYRNTEFGMDFKETKQLPISVVRGSSLPTFVDIFHQNSDKGYAYISAWGDSEIINQYPKVHFIFGSSSVRVKNTYQRISFTLGDMQTSETSFSYDDQKGKESIQVSCKFLPSER